MLRSAAAYSPLAEPAARTDHALSPFQYSPPSLRPSLICFSNRLPITLAHCELPRRAAPCLSYSAFLRLMGGGRRTSHALRKAQAASALLGASPHLVSLRRLRAPSSAELSPFAWPVIPRVLLRAVAAAAAAVKCGQISAWGAGARTAPSFGGDGRETSERASDNGSGGDKLQRAGLAVRPFTR